MGRTHRGRAIVGIVMICWGRVGSRRSAIHVGVMIGICAGMVATMVHWWWWRLLVRAFGRRGT